MIKATGFSRRYGATLAVDNISFEIGKGRIAGFLGPNGAGKTTTIKAFTGTLAPTAGKLSVGGLDTETDPLAVKAITGYLPENNPLYEDMETADYLLYNGAVRGLRGEQLNKAVKSAVLRCGLGDAIGKDIGELSKGFRQRVGLANAIVHNPDVLFLDEPTGGLDPNQADGVRALIRELGREKTILFSTHMLDEARRLCDDLVIISRGRLATCGPAEQVLRQGENFEITLSAAASAEAVTAVLSALPGVTDCTSSEEGGELRFALVASKTDLRPSIYAAAVKNGWPVLEIRKAASSLEDIFRSLTL